MQNAACGSLLLCSACEHAEHLGSAVAAFCGYLANARWSNAAALHLQPAEANDLPSIADSAAP